MIIENALELTKIWCSSIGKPLTKEEVLEAYEWFRGELLLKIKPAQPFVFQETNTNEDKKEDKNSSDFFKKVFKM